MLSEPINPRVTGGQASENPERPSVFLQLRAAYRTRKSKRAVGNGSARKVKCHHSFAIGAKPCRCITERSRLVLDSGGACEQAAWGLVAGDAAADKAVVACIAQTHKAGASTLPLLTLSIRQMLPICRVRFEPAKASHAHALASELAARAPLLGREA
jgi:hypothetical protein